MNNGLRISLLCLIIFLNYLQTPWKLWDNESSDLIILKAL